jgi:hypothetical protein
VKGEQTGKFEYQFIITFFVIKHLRSNLIHTELENIFGATMYSLTQVKSASDDSRQATALVRTIPAHTDRVPAWRSLSEIPEKSFRLRPASA